MIEISKDITNHLPTLVEDYIAEKPELKQLYTNTPKLSSFKNISRDFIYRKELIEALKKQTSSTHPSVIKNINLLEKSNTYTVTTGHQLGVFGGPLYFVFKIISTINLAKKLSAEYPDKNFVPVFWMASEDHDKEEVDHVYLFGKKITWNTDQTGAVGRFNLSDIAPFLDEIKDSYREIPTEVSKLIAIYENSATLTEATQKLVYHLFESKGIVVIDGDSKDLKKLMLPIFKNELLKRESVEKVNEASHKLDELDHKTLVHPREINLFYLKGNIRERIIFEDDLYKVLNTDLTFSESEILKELENNPERFSPNVVLRPVYQETILPNIAYIGGPGEISYWLQLKPTFDLYKIPYPIVIPRNFGLLIPSYIQKKIEKTGISPEDIFLDKDALIKKYIVENSEITFDEEIKGLEEVFSLAKEKVVNIDFSLEKTVIAELKKAQNAIQQIKSKAIRAEKKNNETLVNQLSSIKDTLFPDDTPQERHDNLLNYYDEDLIDLLLKRFTPFDYNLNVIEL